MNRGTASWALAAGALLLCVGSAPAAKPKADRRAVAGELIVGFDRDVPPAARTAALEAAGGKVKKSFDRIRAKLVQVDPAAAEALRKRLASDPRVRYVEPNYVLTADALPDDPSFAQLWGLHNTGQVVNGAAGTAGADIDAPEAWDVTGGAGAGVVGIIDTGVDFSHPDLQGTQWVNPGEDCAGCRTNGVDDDGNGYVDDWGGWDWVNDDNDPFDDHGHGTHVAGTIAAAGNDGAGVTGINWSGVRIMALKFLSAGGSGSTADAVSAVLYATANGANVTNNSWGGGAFSQALFDAITGAAGADSLFVAAAGNEGSSTDGGGHYPSSYEAANIVSVAATGSTDALASFSNFGRRTVDLGAPGVSVYSTIPGGAYGFKSGTSMATPHVTGAVAQVLAAQPGADALGIKALLLETADPISALAGMTASGGRLNVDRAVRCSERPVVWLDGPADGFVASVGTPVQVTAIAANCADVDTATVSAIVNGEPIELSAAGHGIYTGTFAPSAAGPVDVVATASVGTATVSRTAHGAVESNYGMSDAVFAWVDATAGGTKLALTGDDAGEAVSLPFAFTYFNQSYTSVKVGTNGHLVFGPSAATLYINAQIPSSTEPNGVVAALWDDLYVSASSAVWTATVGTAPNRRFAVEWVDVQQYSDRGGGVTFEVVLEEATGTIRFQYADLTFSGLGYDNGASATVGVESVGGTVGRQFSFATTALTPYVGAAAIAFTPGESGPPPPSAPDTRIDSGPSGATRSTSATFAFSSPTAGVGFECALDAAAFTACASPLGYLGLAEGSHTFRVRAIDSAGTADPSPASRTWTVDVTAPDTTITAVTITGSNATLSFTSTESGAAECSLEATAFAACASPASYYGLAPGSHAFRVRAIDAAGNVDPTPAAHTWSTTILPNGSFEPDTATGWMSRNSVITRQVGGAADGSAYAHIEWWRSGSTFGIETYPSPLRPTPAGGVYRADAWVRGLGGNRTTCLRMRELSPSGAVLASAQTCLVPGSSWRRFATVQLTTVGGGELDVDVLQTRKPRNGDWFELDGVAVG